MMTLDKNMSSGKRQNITRKKDNNMISDKRKKIIVDVKK